MADVRLTATNPEDSSVVPVACNEKGELKLEEPLVVEGPPGEQGEKGEKGDPGDPFSGNFAGDVTFGGSATFAGNIAIATSGAAADFYRKSNAISGSLVSFYSDNGSTKRKVAEIKTDGSAEFAGDVEVKGAFTCLGRRGPGSKIAISNPANRVKLLAYNAAGTDTINLDAEVGSATFTGDVVVGSRGSKWMIVESGGLAHLIQQTSFKGQPRSEYPQLRNIPNELTMVEQALAEVMEKLRMIPPAGWEVWDGSSENS